MIEDVEEFEAWYRLVHCPGLGRTAARALLSAFGCPELTCRASPAQWRAVVGEGRTQAMVTGLRSLDAGWVQALAWWRSGPHRKVIAIGDARYPAALLRTDDPPLLLYLEGHAAALDGQMLAIIGSRQPTPQGARNAHDFALHLGGAGWTIVSGLARGIDAAAHEGALASRALTVAVVGTGLDQTYPRTHAALAGRIAEQGVVISEFPPGTPPLGQNFPSRNRIIAGLARGTLVVEAALQSGSLITARMATEAGREVFAIPGSIHSPLSRGCHALIRQGAKLVESATDILEELPLGAASHTRERPIGGSAAIDVTANAESAATSSLPPEDSLLQAIGHEPITLDALSAHTGWPAATLATRLLELELCGEVTRMPGGLFQRLHRA